MPAEFATTDGSGQGPAFLIAAGIVYEIIAASCSSPQTTEINAGSRSRTLMKWVNIGVAQAAGFVVIAAAIDPKHRKAIVSGGVTAGVLMYVQYEHARRAGLRGAAAGQPGTEGPGSNKAAGGAAWNKAA
jgi:hypothetical protein